MNDYTTTKATAGDLAESGYWKASPAQTLTKILAGQEIGIPPVAAMQQVQVIQGKVTLGAGAIAGKVKGSGKYTYRVAEHSSSVCRLVFWELVSGAWEEIGVSVFTMDDAEAAGLASNGNWRRYPRNMLFARAISNGARWHCPDVFHGSIYTPEELQTENPSIQLNPSAPPPTPEPAPPAKDPPPPATFQNDLAIAWSVEKGAYASEAEAAKALGVILADLNHEANPPPSAIRSAWVEEVNAVIAALAEENEVQVNWTDGERISWQRCATRLYAVCGANGADTDKVKEELLDRYEDEHGIHTTTTKAIPPRIWRPYVNAIVARLEG